MYICCLYYFFVRQVILDKFKYVKFGFNVKDGPQLTGKHEN